MLAYALMIFFPFLMIYAAVSDLVSMSISNKLSLGLMIGFMFFALAVGFSWEAIGWHWAMFVIVLLCGFTLFSFGIVGGGDAKLAAATALWFGWDHVLEYLLLSSILGAVLTLALISFRSQGLPISLMRVTWIERLSKAETGVPYGIALGAGALIVYPGTPWMEHAVSVVVGL